MNAEYPCPPTEGYADKTTWYTAKQPENIGVPKQSTSALLKTVIKTEENNYLCNFFKNLLTFHACFFASQQVRSNIQQ